MTDYDEILEMGIFDFNFGTPTSLMRSEYDIPTEKDFSSDSAVLTMIGSLDLTSTTGNPEAPCESGNRMMEHCDAVMEGNEVHAKEWNSRNDAETRENMSELEDMSDTPLKDWLSEIIETKILEEGETIKWKSHLSHDTEQSIESLESMLSDDYEKTFCDKVEQTEDRNENDDSDFDLEAFFNSTNTIELTHELKYWSIFTDNLRYPFHNPDCESLLFVRKSNVLSKYYPDSYNMQRQRTNNNRKDYFLQDKNDKTYEKEEIEEVNRRFDEVSFEVEGEFDPRVDISATYLFSTKEAKWRDPENKIFRRGVINLSDSMKVLGKIANGEICRTLIDSGATTSMMSRNFYESHEMLKTCPIYKIPKVKIKVANDEIMHTEECIKFIEEIQGHTFELIAYLLPMGNTIDVIMGVKACTEIEGHLCFTKMEFEFRERSIPLYLETNLELHEHESKDYYVKFQRPEGFEDGKVLLKLPIGKSNGVPQLLWADSENGRICLTVTNKGKEVIKFDKGSHMGIADMRSVGYYYLSRNSIQNMLEQRFVLMEENYDNCDKAQNFWPNELAKDDTNPIIKDRYQDSGYEEEEEHKTQMKVKPEEKKDTKRVKYIAGYKVDPDDKYPWLDPDDPRRNMTDREILEKFVDMSDSILTPKQIRNLYDDLEKYKEAFSLRDEIGECPNMEIEIELTDNEPFFIRPYPCKEEHKKIIDKEMRKGCLLGILRKGLTSYSSPIMLIPRKTGIPRIVTDFRYLNSRIKILQCSLPLVRDAIQQLGASNSEIASILDLRDAFHTLRVALRSQDYLGITPYYGSPSFVYQRMGMGWKVSPAFFMYFITGVLDSLENHRENFLAIMDDILVHSKVKDHRNRLITLFKALIKNGLKISPKKCQLFKKDVVYMGHQISYREKIPTITPTKDKCEVIRRLDQPKGVRDIRSFCGMVNYLSLYLPRLQELLAPMYDLTRKGAKFEWSEQCETNFVKIKELLVKPPILVMPNTTGYFTLSSDTSIIATGCALYQEQKGENRLCGYNSKRLPEAASRYSISELELLGLTINIASFKTYLKNTSFSVEVDHSALVNIMHSKKEPPTLRIKKLLEVFKSVLF